LDFFLDHLADTDLNFFFNLVWNHDGELLVAFFHHRLAAHDSASAGLLLWNTNGELDIAGASLALGCANFLSASSLFWFADRDFVLVRLIFANDLVDRDINLLLNDFRNPNFLSASRRLWAASRTTAGIATLHECLNLNRSIFPVTAVLTDRSLFGCRNALRDLANTLTLFGAGDHDGELGRHFFPFRNAHLKLFLASLNLLFPDRVFLGHFFRFLNELAGSDFPSLSFWAAFRHQNFASLSSHLRNQNSSFDHARCRSTGWLRAALIRRSSADREHEESKGRYAGPQSLLHDAIPFPGVETKRTAD
jgi:hypothetical protein